MWAVGAALGFLWLVFLRPPFLGGSTSYVLVGGISMEPGLHTGDLVLVRRQADYAVGDVVAYRVPDGEQGEGAMVIHRVVGGDGVGGFRTRGDNSDSGLDDPWQPRASDVVGRLWLRVPLVGPLVVLLRSTVGFAMMAGLIAFWIALGPSERKDEPVPDRANEHVEVAS
jgi:signal peptidase